MEKYVHRCRTEHEDAKEAKQKNHEPALTPLAMNPTAPRRDFKLGYSGRGCNKYKPYSDNSAADSTHRDLGCPSICL
jgi:hypothetical protein